MCLSSKSKSFETFGHRRTPTTPPPSTHTFALRPRCIVEFGIPVTLGKTVANEFADLGFVCDYESRPSVLYKAEVWDVFPDNSPRIKFMDRPYSIVTVEY